VGDVRENVKQGLEWCGMFMYIDIVVSSPKSTARRCNRKTNTINSLKSNSMISMIFPIKPFVFVRKEGRVLYRHGLTVS